jgi:hypothetical protein
MSKLTKELYTQDALDRARHSAEEWLSDHSDGWPRSWDQEERSTVRREYELYDHDFEAPPIAGYEAMEAAGLVERRERVVRSGEERIRFTLTDAGRTALGASGE